MGAGWPGTGGGGGTGNLSGDLTDNFIPVASGLHSLEDSSLFQNGASELQVRQRSITSYKDGGANLHIVQAAQGAAQFYGKSSQGTIAAPTVLNDGDVIASLDGAGYNGTNFYHAGYLQLKVDGTPSAGNCPGKWLLYTLDDVGVEHLGLVQNPDGTIESSEDFTAQAAATVAGAFTANGTADFNGEVTLDTNVQVNKTTKNRYQGISVSGGAVAIDASLSDWYDLPLGANATLSAPTNPDTGRKMLIRVRNGGAFTLAFSAKFRFRSNVAPVVTPSATSYLYFVYNELDDRWDELGEMLNFV